MKPLMVALALVSAFTALPVEAQPAKGASAAFERVRGDLDRSVIRGSPVRLRAHSPCEAAR
jgi:hypothetical protein